MSAYTNVCARCRTTYEATRADSRYCSSSCRALASQARKKAAREAWVEKARDLQKRQTALIIAGDREGLEALVAEIEQHFASEPR